MRHWRFVIGRALVHIGLKLMPSGPARSELFSLFDRWSTHVEAVVRRGQPIPSNQIEG